jgi:hypothetical protein
MYAAEWRASVGLQSCARVDSVAESTIDSFFVSLLTMFIATIGAAAVLSGEWRWCWRRWRLQDVWQSDCLI